MKGITIAAGGRPDMDGNCDGLPNSRTSNDGKRQEEVEVGNNLEFIL
jgi:hypothetical protein